MKPGKRTSAVLLATVLLALGTSGLVAAKSGPGRSSTAPAGSKTKTTKVTKVFKENGLLKTVTTLTTGKKQTVITTYVKNGVKYVLTVVKVNGKVVSHSLKKAHKHKAKTHKKH